MYHSALFKQLQELWSAPPTIPPHRTQDSPQTSIEILLEPIRYSMAFLTLFSVVSTVIVAIILVPFEPLQLLAQFVSLTVSLSGLFGTFKRSILLSSIYALSMLLFLFLQCSYFFVLLKLVQEVNIGNSNNNSDKLLYADLASYPDGSPSVSVEPFKDSNQDTQFWPPSELTSQRGSHSPSHSISLLPPSIDAISHRPYHQEPYQDRRQPPPPSAHVRHILMMLGEELAYLSLLTVPMIAWLPPSLFMETVAVLLLSMQALAAACFLYALHHRSASHRYHQKILDSHLT